MRKHRAAGLTATQRISILQHCVHSKEIKHQNVPLSSLPHTQKKMVTV